MKLFFFHHAGGSGVFFSGWKMHLNLKKDDIILLDLPGRGRYINSPPLQTFEDVISFLCQQVASSLEKDEDYITFGHSLGAEVSFFFARNMQRMGYLPPRHMFISSCPSPDRPISSESKSTSGMSKNELLDRIRRIGGTSEQILNSEEFLDFFYPILRADFILVDSYSPVTVHPEGKINCPITVLYGDEDKSVEESDMNGWSLFTSGKCDFKRFSGDHFYLSNNISHICSMINKTIGVHYEKGIVSAM